MALANRNDDICCPYCGIIVQKAIYSKTSKDFIGHSYVIGWEDVNKNHKCKKSDNTKSFSISDFARNCIKSALKK